MKCSDFKENQIKFSRKIEKTEINIGQKSVLTAKRKKKKFCIHLDNFNFVGLAGGEATRGEEAGTDKKKGKKRGILVYDCERST